MTEKINSYKDLRVFQNAMKAAMKIFELSENFPPEEKYSMTDQLRRSSRAVCANITRAWRKRRFKTPFIAKLNDSEGEACEEPVREAVVDAAREAEVVVVEAELFVVADAVSEATLRLREQTEPPGKRALALSGQRAHRGAARITAAPAAGA